MKLIKNAIILALGGAALHAFMRKRPGAVSASAEAGSGRATTGARRAPTAASDDSPNAAERLQGGQTANGLAGNERLRASLLGSDAAHRETPRATGLADFTRGA